MAEIDALSLAKQEGQMVLIKMELIVVAQKLVAANKHQHHLRHIDKSSLTNMINIR
jgi:hypothetical protein